MADKWQDVIQHPQGGFAFAESLAGKVKVTWRNVVWETNVPTDFLRMIRMAASPEGEIRVVGIGADDNVYEVGKNLCRVAGRSSYQNGCAIVHNGTQFVIYCQTSATTYTKNGVEFAMEESSQGFQDVFPDGRIVFGRDTVDAWWIDTSNAGRQRLHYRTERGDYIAGDANDAIGLFKKSTKEFWVVRKGTVNYGIHLAVDGDKIAIVAMINGGEGFVGEYPPLPEQEEPKPEEPKPEEPKPEEPKTEEPKPMPEIKSLKPTVVRIRAKYGERPSEEELGKMLNEIAWIHRADGWGLSVKPNGTNAPSPQGKKIAHDVLHKMPEDLIFDVFIAAGERAEPTWNLVAHHNDPDRPWLAPVKPEGFEEPEEPQEPEEPTDPDPEDPQEPDYEGLLELIIERVTAAVKVEVDKAVAELRDELRNIEFEGKHRLLGTITFKRTK